jgi:hypothetical protein
LRPSGRETHDQLTDIEMPHRPHLLLRLGGRNGCRSTRDRRPRAWYPQLWTSSAGLCITTSGSVLR